MFDTPDPPSAGGPPPPAPLKTDAEVQKDKALERRRMLNRRGRRSTVLAGAADDAMSGAAYGTPNTTAFGGGTA